MLPTALLATGLTAAFAASPAQNLLARDLSWRVVNDSVMGGVSQGRLIVDEDSVAFVGVLSLENNGGFASVRTVPTALGLGEARGLAVTVRGDGRTWWLTLGSRDRPLGAGSYRAPLPTREGEETTVEVDFGDFQYTAYGRPVRGAPPLTASPDRVDSLGVLLSDKQPGPFRIALVAVRPLGHEEDAADPTGRDGRTALKQSLSAALRLGVPAFNEGDPGRCRAHYQTAIESALLLSPGALTTTEQDSLLAALRQSESMDDTAAAWALREAMDRVLLR